MSEELQPVFSIERLYVKDLSLEVPHAPQIFLEQGEPEVDMRVSTGSQKLEDGYYNVDVTVTVTAKLDNERTMFLNEVTQSGIFRFGKHPRRRCRPAARRGVSEHPLPLRARSRFRHGNARRLPARLACAD